MDPRQINLDAAHSLKMAGDIELTLGKRTGMEVFKHATQIDAEVADAYVKAAELELENHSREAAVEAAMLRKNASDLKLKAAQEIKAQTNWLKFMEGKRSRKNPSSGWHAMAPSKRQRTVMRKKCGAKCFLGPGLSYPVCAKNSCKINPKGVHAAYSRAREWHHESIAKRAKRFMR